jgi:hypothetical protein
MDHPLRFIFIVCVLAAGGRVFAESQAPSSSPDSRFATGEELARDDFAHGLEQWRAELENGGTVKAADGAMDIDVPRGCSVWFKQPFSGPVIISYEATAVKKQGANDRVSDLNCFWMAQDSRSPGDLFATPRTGKFSDYDPLRCYYVGLGGNSNTTTRFRRYIGQAGNRPLLPEQDLSAQEYMLAPNVAQRIDLLAAGNAIAYFRDGRRIFTYDDPQPYQNGWFAFRTTRSHLRIRHFIVRRLR